VQACDDALTRGIGAIDLEGKIVDGPLLKHSQAILTAAQQP